MVMNPNTRIQRLVTYGTLAIVAAAILASPRWFSVNTARAGGSEPTPPDTLELTGVVRDFKEWNVAGGHPDFDLDVRGCAAVGCACGHYSGMVADTLGSDGKPVYTGSGFQVTSQWKDKANRPISYNLFDAALGDTAGVKGCNGGGVKNTNSFNEWFNDVPGVNMSMPLTVTLVRQADGSYVFDDKNDATYKTVGGFFPIDGQLFGNPPVKKGVDHNYHFTFELHTQFKYRADENQTFKFVGDDDVWVFIDGKKVIDLGGIHGATEQFVSLDRLGLTHNKTYSLDFYFAERNRVASNCRISTNIKLTSTDDVPSVTAAFD